jgi:very-short-patch-repair endonuclease
MAGQNSQPHLLGLVGDLAERQHGVVARLQLLRLGLSRMQIDRLVANRWLRPIFRGVYAVGRANLSLEGRWMAAVLWGGRGAVLSHRSALMLWKLTPRSDPVTHLTIPHDRRLKAPPRVRVHRSTNLARVTTARHEIPVTKPARSIVDFAETTDRRGLERVVDEADRLGLVKPPALQAELDHHPGRRGHPLLQAVLDDHAIGTTATANDFEELFLAIVDRHRIPRPIVNRAHGRKRPDFRWPQHRVIVETDGKGHLADLLFESDRERDNDHAVAGWLTLRFTWKHLTTRETWVAETVKRALALRAVGESA